MNFFSRARVATGILFGRQQVIKTPVIKAVGGSANTRLFEEGSISVITED